VGGRDHGDQKATRCANGKHPCSGLRSSPTLCMFRFSTRRCSTLSDVSKYTRQSASMAVERRLDPYHGKRKGDSLDWNRCEVVMEDNPISIIALEPHHINSILDDRMLIWISSPVNVGFLYVSGIW